MGSNIPIILSLKNYKLLLDIADSNGDRKISKEELAELNSIFNNKNGVEFVDYEQILRNVMHQTKESLENNNNDIIPETAEYFFEDDGNSFPLADAIYRELSTEKKNINLPNSNKKLLDLIKQLNSYNFQQVNEYYQKKYGTTIGKALKSSSLNLQTATLMSEQVESCRTNSQKQYTSPELAKLLFEDIKGLGTSQTIAEHVNAINKNNVIGVMQCYKANNDNKDHKSLISDIMEEYGLDINKRIK